MALRTILLTGLRILAVCLLFAVCFAVGGVLSGLDKIGQRTVASQPTPPANQQVPLEDVGIRIHQRYGNKGALRCRLAF
jgi:hypothetical protein